MQGASSVATEEDAPIQPLLVKQEMKNVCLLAFCLAMTISVHAQSERTWEKYLDALLLTDDNRTEDYEEMYFLLTELEQHPICLNTATREELERIPFLTAQQVEDLQAYVYQYKGFKTLAELALIESIDGATRELLKCFVYLADAPPPTFPHLSEIGKYGKHTLLLTGKLPFYQRKGDKTAYLGYPYSHSFRYTFQYKDYLKAGFVGAQDAGEPFFSHHNTLGYDHYGFYLMLQRMGRIKSLTIGRYTLSFGQGLVMNGGFSLGKSAMLLSSNGNRQTLRPHSSRVAHNYLQGIATTIALTHHIDLSAFFSYRKIDATLTEEGKIKTILKSGYHRTLKEIERKNNAAQTSAGTYVQWKKDGKNLGLTAVYTQFDRPLMGKNYASAHRYVPQSNHFWSISTTYGYRNHKYDFSGELATGSSGGLATLNNLEIKFSNRLNIHLSQRFYGHQYYAPFANSIGENSSTQNEMGGYVGVRWSFRKGLIVNAYTDFSHFSYPRYLTSSASSAWDNFLGLTYQRKKLTFIARYAIKIRTRDNKLHTRLEQEMRHRGRIALSYDADRWTTKTQIDFSQTSFQRSRTGYMLSQQFGWRPKPHLQTYFLLAYFHTDDFASRIYTYEPGVSYGFHYPAYYGKGLRYCVIGRINIAENLLLQAKLGSSFYFDRTKIASGLQEINSPSATDLEMQMKWTF